MPKKNAAELIEINIDGLVGPSHHFGGLGVGNIASLEHAHHISHPREAALEGLEKANLLASLGLPQLLFLPPPRPRLDLLRQFGFEGDVQSMLEAAYHTAPHTLSAAFSSAFMWAANSATVTAAVDSTDAQTHFTPANLISSWHRGVEAEERTSDLKHLFATCEDVAIHDPLPAIVPLRDEGAANHMRLCDASGLKALNLFVYGVDETVNSRSSIFYPRQTRAAWEAVVRRHHLIPENTFLLQQHPEAIDAGVFHNDVIATSHQNLLLYHERAFIDSEPSLERIDSRFRQLTGRKLIRRRVSEQELPLTDAIGSYFFNSQIVSPRQPQSGWELRPGNWGGSEHPRMALICPQQCRDIASARRLIENLLSDSEIPIDEVHFVPLGQSMANGGGPACLRLRVPLPLSAIEKMPSHLYLTPPRSEQLAELIRQYYPAKLEMKDFRDRATIEALQRASAAVQGATLQARSSS